MEHPSPPAAAPGAAQPDCVVVPPGTNALLSETAVTDLGTEGMTWVIAPRVGDQDVAQDAGVVGAEGDAKPAGAGVPEQ